MIELVPLHLVDVVWGQLAEGMAKACAKTDCPETPGHLHAMCRRGEAYLVVDFHEGQVRGGVVCEEQRWPKRTVLYVHALCGHELTEWAAKLKDFARDALKVQSVVFESRAGLGRVVPGARELWRRYEVDVG